MSEKMKSRLVGSFYILGAIGLIDMSIQLATDGEVKLVRAFLGYLFGNPA